MTSCNHLRAGCPDGSSAIAVTGLSRSHLASVLTSPPASGTGRSHDRQHRRPTVTANGRTVPFQLQLATRGALALWKPVQAFAPVRSGMT